MKKMISVLLALALAAGLAACGAKGGPEKTPGDAGSEKEPEKQTEQAADSGKAADELNIYMWQQYISDDLVKQFEDENNCAIHLSYMSDNADAVTKLTAGGGAEYDLIMTCDAYMESLIAGDYLEKLNLEHIPNSAGLNKTYWPSSDYCIPYLMNYIYVVYDRETCPIEITCYNDLIKPELKGKITTIDGARNLFPIALVALGYDPNSTEESEIAEAYEWLVKFNENVVAYGNAEQNLTNGTACVALTFDGNASWAMAEKDTLAIADFTSDPVQLGFDLYVVPKGAKHVELAEKFLDFILTPEVMAKNLEEFPYSCPNEAAVAVASEGYKNDPCRDFSYKENIFLQKDVGDALTIYNDYYQKLKVGE